MEKVVSVSKALAEVKDGMTVMIGGMLANGTPEVLVDALIRKGVKNLTLISNDTAFPDRGVGKMVVAKMFKKIIVDHIGTNPETQRQMNAGELEVVLVPQGTLVEQIRCGGNGLGGFLTPTGVGTEVEQGKQKLTIGGRDYLLELPLKADVALLYGTTVDKFGNIAYRYAQRNFNPLMAMAAKQVIVEAEEVVETGQIAPDTVITQGIFVDYIVKSGR